MAKKDKLSGAPAAMQDAPMQGAPVAPADATAVTEAPAKNPIGIKGPRGVALDSKISILAPSNPKRPGSRAFDLWTKYVEGMTVQAYMDATGDQATPALVYDSSHGFIKIEGYDPKLVVRKERPAKAPKAPKTPKAPKADKSDDSTAAVVVEETID